MLYVAAAPAPRLGAMLTSAGGGPTVLVVPESGLIGGRPRGLRGPALATLSVTGCRGFLLGAGRDSHRTRGERTTA